MRFLILFIMLIPQFSLATTNTTGILTMSTLTATVTSTKALSRNEARVYLLIQNTGAQTIIVKFNSVQSALEGIQIPAGGNYEPLIAPKDAVYVETASATSGFTIMEGI